MSFEIFAEDMAVKHFLDYTKALLTQNGFLQ